MRAHGAAARKAEAIGYGSEKHALLMRFGAVSDCRKNNMISDFIFFLKGACGGEGALVGYLENLRGEY